MHRRAFAAIEQAELNARGIDRLAHRTAEGVDFTHDLPLGNATDRRIAAHLGDGVAIGRQQRGPRPDRAAASAASVPACPAPITRMSNSYIGNEPGTGVRIRDRLAKPQVIFSTPTDIEVRLRFRASRPSVMITAACGGGHGLHAKLVVGLLPRKAIISAHVQTRLGVDYAKHDRDLRRFGRFDEP